jgi:hypothetical protein
VADDDLERLIDAWADRRVPDLIARAEADALAAAARRLQSRLEAALLKAAERRMAAPVEERPADGSVVWVYGIVGAEGATAPVSEGVDDHPVTVHTRAGQAALVSLVPRESFDKDALGRRLEDLDDVAGLARAHDRVLEAAASKGAVVPFRLCTIYSSLERLDVMLDAEAARLTSTLRRLEGTQEWGVKAFARAPEEAVAGEAPATGTAYLTLKREHREAAEEQSRAVEAAVASIHARLAERAAAATASAPHDRRLSGHDAEMLLNGAYLVPADGTDAFRELVEQLAREHEAHGLEIELTGPWPPYHFVDPPTDARDAG